jgi:hypothetical protein
MGGSEQASETITKLCIGKPVGIDRVAQMLKGRIVGSELYGSYE